MLNQNQFEKFCQLNKSRPDFYQQLKILIGEDLIEAEKPPFIWLETNACSGDSISTMNAVKPGLEQVLCSLLDVRYWSAIMPEEDQPAINSLVETVESGNFILAVEGAIPLKENGFYAVPFKIGDYRVTALELVEWMAPLARYIVAVGTCAAFGGPSAARPNPSGSVGIWEVIKEIPVVNVSGCPINPNWFLGTIYHLLRFGIPKLDRYNRPTLFYGRTIHEACQRRSYFDLGQFAKNLGDPECMFSIGCLGPVTGADCPLRLWNDHLNWPVKASSPCIGCTKAGFPDKATPFYTPLPRKKS